MESPYRWVIIFCSVLCVVSIGLLIYRSTQEQREIGKLRPVGLILVDKITEALKANASFIERRTIISSMVEVVPKSRPRLFRIRLVIKFSQPDDKAKIEPLSSRYVGQYMSTDDRLYVFTDFQPLST